MITRHVIRPHAKEDLESQLDYYAREAGLDVAMRFLGGHRASDSLSVSAPGCGLIEGFREPGFERSAFVARSRFEEIRIYYVRPDENTLRIVRILHGKRDLARILN